MNEVNNFGPDPIKKENTENLRPIAIRKTNGIDPVFKIVAIILAVFLIILCVSTIFDIASKTQGEGEVVTNEERGTISVSATGTTSVVPNIAQVNIGIETETDSIQEAVAENNRKITNIINYAQGKGIASDDIQTVDFSVEPQYQKENDKVAIKKYKTSTVIQVTIRNIDIIGEVLQSSLDAGANTVGNLTFIVEDQDQYLADARKQAIENAQKQAQEIAENLNVTLGDPENYSEYSYGATKSNMAYGMGGEESISISAGTNDITINVNITYSIK